MRTMIAAALLLCSCGEGGHTSVPSSTKPAANLATSQAGAPMSTPTSAPQDPAPLASALIEQLGAKQLDEAYARFSPAMQSAISKEKLRETWELVLSTGGAFQRVLGVKVVPGKGDFLRTQVTTLFEKGEIVFRVTLRPQDGLVEGFFMGPLTASYVAPDYVSPSAILEREVKVGPEERPVPGAIVAPLADGKFPAVVLLHGSGPSDLDATVGPQKIFRDLALGLASRGVVVLRYDKRTLVYGHEFSDTDTLQQESIDDALAGVALLRADPKVDPARVYLLGHSQGGMTAPRAAAQLGQAPAGLVMMAAPSRPLEDAIARQFEYIARSDGTFTPIEGMQIEAIKKQVERVKASDLAPDTAKSLLPLGLSGSYWLDLRAHPAPEVAKTLPIPMLFLQGERDYQVEMEDLAGWKSALAGRADVTFKSYPSLNHLFLPGTGPSTPEEYKTPGHIPKEVIDDIAAWMGASLPPRKVVEGR